MIEMIELGAAQAERDAAVAIGVFDGVHLGHRRVIGRTLISATRRGLVPTVITFDPHPIEVLAPGLAPRLLTTLEERVDLLANIGVRRVGVLDLNEIRTLSPEGFVSEILLSQVGSRHVAVGPDFRFGHDRTGDVELLAAIGSARGFTVESVALLTDDRGVVSSTRIREMVENGEVEAASRLLGSPFVMSGEVIRGDRRGRQIGFPTANLVPDPRKAQPRDGVYSGYGLVGDGSRYRAAINIGIRPTFLDGGVRLVEAYLLDFDGDIYGEHLIVELVDRLRDEEKFPTVDGLVNQIEKDVAQAARLPIAD